MRKSAIRHEILSSCSDPNRLCALENTTAEKPADSSRSLGVSRIDSSSSTIATSGPLRTSISDELLQSERIALGPYKTIVRTGGASALADKSDDKSILALPPGYGALTTSRRPRPGGPPFA